MDTAIALCESSFKGDLNAIRVLVENGMCVYEYVCILYICVYIYVHIIALCVSFSKGHLRAIRVLVKNGMCVYGYMCTLYICV